MAQSSIASLFGPIATTSALVGGSETGPEPPPEEEAPAGEGVGCPTCAGAGGSGGGDKTLTWQNFRLFGPRGPKPSDVKQGATIGDCWLMSALMSIAKTHPEVLERMIRRNKDGTLTVTFQNPKATVTLPPTFALDAKGNPIYGGYGSADHALWPLVIEKAYAQEYGGGKGYDGIGGRSSVEAFSHILGWKTEVAAPSDRSFQDFLNAQNGGWAITALRPYNNDRHAYSVQGFRTQNGVDVVDMYNPWNQQGGDNGKFTMTFEQFQKTYDVYIGAMPPGK